MIDWPLVDELEQLLNTSDSPGVWTGAETSGDGPTRFSRLLEAAIARVKQDVGGWDEDVDFPTAAQASAALQMGFLMATRPGVEAGMLAKDPAYQALLYGSRRTFGIS